MGTKHAFMGPSWAVERRRRGEFQPENKESTEAVRGVPAKYDALGLLPDDQRRGPSHGVSYSL